MKKVTLEQLPTEIQGLLEDLQRHRVLITQNGSPFAVVWKVGNKDEEDLELEESPEFWRMIQERRHEQTAVPFEEVMAELQAEEQRLEGAKADLSRDPQ